MGDMKQSGTYRWWFLIVGLRAIGEVMEKAPNPIVSGIGHVITTILSNTTIEIATGGVAGRAIVKQYGIGMTRAAEANTAGAGQVTINTGAGDRGTERVV